MLTVETRRLNLTHTWTISRNSSSYKDNVFITLSRDGLTGYGEAAPNVRYDESAEGSIAAIKSVDALLAGSDWQSFRGVKQAIDENIADQSCAKAAIDLAIMDWVGKKLGVPLYRLWGIPAESTPLTSLSIGIDTPAVLKEKISAAANFSILKIKLGTSQDKETMETVRRLTDKPLYVDANEGWKNREEAVQKIDWLARQGVLLVEQPMPEHMLEETAWVRERVDLPLVADESVKRCADIPLLAGAFDGINIKLMKSGGLQEALEMIVVARALHLKIMLGCMVESSLGISAAAHLSPLVDWADLDGNQLIANDPFSGVTVEQGKLVLPDRPGIGTIPR